MRVERTALIIVACLLAAYAITALSVQVVPYGASISDKLLDGVIGNEWADAASFSTVIRPTSECQTAHLYSIKIFIKHDCKYLYIAIRESHRFAWSPMAYVCFDVGNKGTVYSKGDDAVILPISEGRLLSNIDRVYDKDNLLPHMVTSPWGITYGIPPKKDSELGGTNDKWGAARASDNGYTYEMKIDMGSGDRIDGSDIFLYPGEKITVELGLMDARFDNMIGRVTSPNLLYLASNEITLVIAEPERYQRSCDGMYSQVGRPCTSGYMEVCHASWVSTSGEPINQTWYLICTCARASGCRWEPKLGLLKQ